VEESIHQKDYLYRTRSGDKDFQGHVNAVGYTGDGSLLVFTGITLTARSDTPADPPSNTTLFWMDSTTGDIKAKITDSGGSTKTGTILDYSAI
jgi:hypothetical protein|tara:strand:+ start:503 stop:781 length:279 start_codon:yes stop_codon:yes gene_type:complete